jgi:hypothetical protein
MQLRNREVFWWRQLVTRDNQCVDHLMDLIRKKEACCVLETVYYQIDLWLIIRMAPCFAAAAEGGI